MMKTAFKYRPGDVLELQRTYDPNDTILDHHRFLVTKLHPGSEDGRYKPRYVLKGVEPRNGYPGQWGYVGRADQLEDPGKFLLVGHVDLHDTEIPLVTDMYSGQDLLKQFPDLVPYVKGRR